MGFCAVEGQGEQRADACVWEEEGRVDQASLELWRLNDYLW